MIWAYAPRRYAIEYSRDGKNYEKEPLIEWRDTVAGGTRRWWENLIPILKSQSRSFPDRITFEYPIWARKMRILMKDPVNWYFGIYRVDIFVKNWTLVIKSTTTGQCKEDCWVINTLVPTDGTKIKTQECIGTIGYSENRELFTLLYDARLLHYNTGYCVTSGLDKQIRLENCNQAEYSNNGRHKYNFWKDGRITPFYAPDECIYKPIDDEPEFIQKLGIAEATSEIADNGHDAPHVIKGNEKAYWASHPGDEFVAMTIYFKIWMSMNMMSITWKYKAVEYDVYAYTYENGWKLIMKVTGNKKEKNALDLKRINARAIQIKMIKAKDLFLKKPIFGIREIKITDSAIYVKRKRCSEVTKNVREWILDAPLPITT